MYYSSLYNWIREHDITKPKWNSEKKDTKTSTQKKHEVNGMTQNGLFDIFSSAIYFAPVVTTTYRLKTNKSSTRGLSLEMSVLSRARVQMLDMPYISTHLSVPHGENI